MIQGRIRSRVVMGDRSRHEFYGEVNLALELYNFCSSFHVLPAAGGLFEQDAYLMLLLESVMSAVEEKAELDAKESRRKGAR